MTSVDSLIDELNHARQAMHKLLADLETAHAASQELYPTWTIKELLSHIAGWDDACIATLEAVSKGTLPATPAARGIDLYNASTVAERAALPLEKVIEEWNQTRETFLQTIRNLPADKLDEPFVFAWGPTGNLTQFVRIFAEHEEEHVKEIREKFSIISS